MPVLKSTTDKECDRFRRNEEAMQMLVDDLRDRTARAAEGGSETSFDIPKPIRDGDYPVS